MPSLGAGRGGDGEEPAEEFMCFEASQEKGGGKSILGRGNSMGKGLEMRKDMTIHVLQTGPASHSHTCIQFFLPYFSLPGSWLGRGWWEPPLSSLSPSPLLLSQHCQLLHFD